MKVTSDNKQFMMTRVNKVILQFSDDYEIILNQIEEWDFDFDKADCSQIELKNLLIDKDICNRFNTEKDRIKFIHIEGCGIDPQLCHKDDIVMFDIQCQMIIRNLRICGETDSCGYMVVELEGVVK